MSLETLDAVTPAATNATDTPTTPSLKSLSSSATSSTHTIDETLPAAAPPKFGALKLYDELVFSVRTVPIGKLKRGARVFNGQTLIIHVRDFLHHCSEEQYHDASTVHAQRVANMLLTAHVVEPLKPGKRSSGEIVNSKRAMYRLCEPELQGSPAPLRASFSTRGKP
eukprot:m.11369 g.11369  ORF g.11369 m.11369 type:complete len:167 (-) comp9800_c0_seq1:500-1000(-)